MSGGDDQDEDKQHEPSQKKLDDARKKGEVPKSNDLITAGAYAGILIAGLAVGGDSLRAVGAALAGPLSRPDIMAALLDGGSGTVIARHLLASIAGPLAPWVMLPIALALLSVVAQRAFTVSGQKLAPKLDRISPLTGAKNKFGPDGLFEFAKSTAKLAIYSVVLGLFLYANLPEMLTATAFTPGIVTTLMLRLSMEFVAIAVGITLAIGAIDFLWQRASHLRKNRMSRKEMMDEHKQSEGDPMMKQRRRQKAHDIAMNTMLADVPKASVVIVNPTHYAVALQWDRSSPGAPVCLAKGVDEIAARIREAAEAAGVPIHTDAPTARALHAVTDVGAEIRPDHYAAVAAAIRFAEAMRAKARKR